MQNSQSNCGYYGCTTAPQSLGHPLTISPTEGDQGDILCLSFQLLLRDNAGRMWYSAKSSSGARGGLNSTPHGDSLGQIS